MVAKHSMEWFDTRPFGKPSGYLLVRGGYCIWAWVKVSNSRKHWLISDPLDWVRLRAFKVPSAPGRCLLFCGFLFLEGLWTPPQTFQSRNSGFQGAIIQFPSVLEGGRLPAKTKELLHHWGWCQWNLAGNWRSLVKRGYPMNCPILGLFYKHKPWI